MILVYKHEPQISCKPLCLHFFKSLMKPETNVFNMHCLPVLNHTESVKGLANREVGLKQIKIFYQTDKKAIVAIKIVIIYYRNHKKHSISGSSYVYIFPKL